MRKSLVGILLVIVWGLGLLLLVGCTSFLPLENGVAQSDKVEALNQIIPDYSNQNNSKAVPLVRTGQTVSGYLDDRDEEGWGDYDWHHLEGVPAGTTITVTLSGPSSADFDLGIWKDGSWDQFSFSSTSSEQISTTAGSNTWVWVSAWEGSGSYTLRIEGKVQSSTPLNFNRWGISWNVVDKQHYHYTDLDKNYVTLTNGGVNLIVPAGAPGRGGEIVSSTEYGYGWYSAYVKTDNVPGTILGFFLYDSDTQDELTLEIINDGSPRVHLTSFIGGQRRAHKTKRLTFDPSASFHWYQLYRTEDSLTLYIDGEKALPSLEEGVLDGGIFNDISTARMKLLINAWPPGTGGWFTPSYPSREAHFDVAYVQVDGY